MKKIIKTTDLKAGTLTIGQLEYMKELNLSPDYDEADKSWNLIKVLTTDTNSVPWLFQLDGMYYVAVQTPWVNRGSAQVSFYPSNEKGKYRINANKMVKRLKFFVDLESACDEFAKQYYQEKIADEGIEVATKN